MYAVLSRFVPVMYTLQSTCPPQSILPPMPALSKVYPADAAWLAAYCCGVSTVFNPLSDESCRYTLFCWNAVRIPTFIYPLVIDFPIFRIWNLRSAVTFAGGTNGNTFALL